MTHEHRLERAGDDLRAAITSMPFPALRTRRSVRGGAMAFATGLAVALIIGIPAYLARTTPPGGGTVVGASNSTTTTQVPEVTSTFAPDPTTTTTTTVNPSFGCGAELPWDVELPEDFSGPLEGPSPQSSRPADEGQLTVHWLGRDGSVEIRWPADAEHFHGAEWGVPMEWDGRDSDEFVLFLYTNPDPQADEKVGAVEMLLPTEIMSGPCDAAQLTVYGPEDSRRGAAFGASVDADVVINPSLPRPRDKVLVVETIETSEIPEVRACDVGPLFEAPPNETGTTPNSPVFDTAVEALQDLLSTDLAAAWPKTGYFELVTPDGRVVYGNPFDDLSLDPRPDNGLVVSVTVVAEAGGWTVTEWETSGC